MCVILLMESWEKDAEMCLEPESYDCGDRCQIFWCYALDKRIRGSLKSDRVGAIGATQEYSWF